MQQRWPWSDLSPVEETAGASTFTVHVYPRRKKAIVNLFEFKEKGDLGKESGKCL